MDYPLSFNVDVVFCVDISESMTPHLDRVGQMIVEFAPTLILGFTEREKIVSDIRARIITFGRHTDTETSFGSCPFHTLFSAGGRTNVNLPVSNLVLSEHSGTTLNNGLAALSAAINSDWTQTGDRLRHIIVVFTDSSAQQLESRVDFGPGARASSMSFSLKSLTDDWQGGDQHGESGGKLRSTARRLLLFAPDVEPWTTIGDNWSSTIFLPSAAGDGLSESDYASIVKSNVFAV
jgi:hypothetical protein